MIKENIFYRSIIFIRLKSDHCVVLSTPEPTLFEFADFVEVMQPPQKSRNLFLCYPSKAVSLTFTELIEFEEVNVCSVVKAIKKFCQD